MKLYHFTSRFHIRGCQLQGLTLGCIPLSTDPPIFLKNYQWLTKNKDFHQAWCINSYSKLPYKRNDYRITIKIPRAETKSEKFIKWLDFCRSSTNPLLPFAASVLNSAGDPHNWYLFHGTIKPEWFIKVSRNKGNF